MPRTVPRVKGRSVIGLQCGRSRDHRELTLDGALIDYSPITLASSTPCGGEVLDSADLVSFVAVSDLDRAQHFYGDQLGLQLRDERPFALVAEGAGTMLRITAVDNVLSVPYTVLGWRVFDLDATIDHLVARGVTFARYEAMEQDERGVWTAPGGSRIAWFQDPDGNSLSLTEFARLG